MDLKANEPVQERTEGDQRKESPVPPSIKDATGKEENEILDLESSGGVCPLIRNPIQGKTKGKNNKNSSELNNMGGPLRPCLKKVDGDGWPGCSRARHVARLKL